MAGNTNVSLESSPAVSPAVFFEDLKEGFVGKFHPDPRVYCERSIGRIRGCGGRPKASSGSAGVVYATCVACAARGRTGGGDVGGSGDDFDGGGDVDIASSGDVGVGAAPVLKRLEIVGIMILLPLADDVVPLLDKAGAGWVIVPDVEMVFPTAAVELIECAVEWLEASLARASVRALTSSANAIISRVLSGCNGCRFFR